MSTFGSIPRPDQSPSRGTSLHYNSICLKVKANRFHVWISDHMNERAERALEYHLVA